jgi:hypothetical protein
MHDAGASGRMAPRAGFRPQPFEPFNLLSETIARLRGARYDRPLRLFAVACCHRIRHPLTDESRRGVGVVKRYARGQAPEAEVDAAADGG